jgi:hypothetical protein
MVAGTLTDQEGHPMKKLKSVVLLSTFVLAISLSAAPRERETGRGGTPREVIVKVIKRLLGVGTNSDIPIPPLPEPKP